MTEIGGARLGGFLSIKSSRILNFKIVRARWIEFSE